MVRLSVNVNKVATLRNSRGGRMPSVPDAVRVCLTAGAAGITVHPRADQRHITPDDVREVASLLAGRPDDVEFNIEGDPRPELVDLVLDVAPDQCTLVPVVPGEITSQAGWQRGEQSAALPGVVSRLKARGIRVSLFVDPMVEAVRFAAELGADRVELYTEPFARKFEQGPKQARSRCRFTRRRQSRPTRSALASTLDTISIWKTSCCSGRCRTWQKCRLAMR